MITRSADETIAAGRALASRLTAGDRVLLEGPLGSGKTTFVQGLAEALGASARATSPSFVLVHEYQLGNGEPAVHPTLSVLRHIDLYRLPDPALDVDRLGLIELLGDPQAIAVVEWADRLPVKTWREAEPPRVVRVTFQHCDNPSERNIQIG